LPPEYVEGDANHLRTLAIRDAEVFRAEKQAWHADSLSTAFRAQHRPEQEIR